MGRGKQFIVRKIMREYYRLAEICDIVMGQSPDSSSYNDHEMGIPFFQGNADFGEIYPVARKWCNKPIKVVKEGTLLISVRAPIGDLNFSREECCIGRGLAGIVVKKDFDIKYIYYILKFNKLNLQLRGTGSTFKAITRAALGETKIKNLPINEQKYFVKCLDGLSSVINQRNKQIKLCESLIKSRFVEMFGSLNDDINVFNVVSIEEVCSLIKDGTHQTPTYTENINEGYKFLSSKDVMSEKIDWTNIKYISPELHEKLYTTIRPQRNDILMSKNGVNYGVAAVNNTDEVFAIDSSSL